MTDPRDLDRRMDMEREAEMGTTSTPYWIAAAVFVIVILVLVLGSLERTRTARENTSPPATTGIAPRTAPPTVPSGEPPSTTGQRAH